jgi:hypothetical protein
MFLLSCSNLKQIRNSFEILLLSLILILGVSIIEEVNYLLFKLTKHASDELAKPGRQLESAKFSVRHFDKMPKSLALKAFQRL